MKNLTFNNRFQQLLPETYRLLTSSGMKVHDSVTTVVLHGSRGLAGGYRPDSDIDLSLITDTGSLTGAELESLLNALAQTTLDNWYGSVELDIAVIFDKRRCGLDCFTSESWNEAMCPDGGTDCFGIYKIQKGFSGIVGDIGISVPKILPCMVIWSREN